MSGVAPVPSLAERLASLPRRHLAPLPTPLTPAPNLGSSIGLPGLWFKRDDLIAFGMGGNKVRGLEFLVADALVHGADVIVTGAGTQSNHVRATAAAAAAASLDAIAVYWGREPARAEGNFALTLILGAQTHFTESDDRASVDVHLERVAAELRAAGRRPYVIPRGGACALGVIGHILAVEELALQCRELGIAPDTVVLAVGSGGTYAGWLLGIRFLGLGWRVVGYAVSRPANESRERIVALAREAAALARIDVNVDPRDVVVHDEFLGAGYGIPTAEGDAVTQLAARHEGVFLDPTYTAKAFAGLEHETHSGRYYGSTILHERSSRPYDGSPAAYDDSSRSHDGSRASHARSRTDDDRSPTVVFVHTGGLPTLSARTFPLR